MVNENIVIVGQQPWDTAIGSNCKDIALVFSKHNRVLYVNSPLDRITSMRSRNDPGIRKRLDVISGKSEGLIELAPNLWNLYPDCMVESINWLSNKWLFDKINQANNRRFADAIRKALKRLGFDQFYLFNDNEIIKCHYLADLLKPKRSVYYSRDYILATPYWKKHGAWLEPRVIAMNDVCVANSLYLADYCKQYNPNAHYVGQGCDFRYFSFGKTYPVPPELQGIDTPIIGYVGALQSIRLDVSLLERLASERTDWTLVLVGPEDEVFQKSKLHELSNVRFIGLKPLSTLAHYISRFDVCVNPQAVNDLTIGNYPRKVDEYLALGKPVVATRTRAMAEFGDIVYLADSAHDYPRLIELALQEDSVALRRRRADIAGNHTWENSVEKIYKAMKLA